MPQTLILIECASDMPNLEAQVRHFSRGRVSGHVLLVLMKGQLQGEYPFVIRLPWHMRRNSKETMAYLQGRFSFQVVIHVGKYVGLKSLLSETCRYIHLSPLGRVHGLTSSLFWERELDILDIDDSTLNSGPASFCKCMAYFSEKGVVDQFRPPKKKHADWVYEVSSYAIIYLGHGETKKGVAPLMRAVLRRHERCVLIVKNRVQKYPFMARYAFNKQVVIMDGNNAYTLLPILKKCREVFVSTHKDILAGIMLGKKVRVYGANGMYASLISNIYSKNILPGYCVMPSFFLFEEGFLSHLIQADISRGPVLDGNWVCRLDARGDKRRRRNYQRKIKKLIADPERFFKDSKKGWVRQWGKMAFKPVSK